MMKKDEILRRITEKPILAVEHNLRERFPDAYAEIAGIRFPDGFNFQQKMYHYPHDDLELNNSCCGTCGKPTRFNGSVRVYLLYCSLTMEIYEDACRKGYGVENAFQSSNVNICYSFFNEK